jgi:hypothetical protein
MNYLEEDLQLFELVVDADEDGVFANSFVEEPAIERDFVFFNKHKEVTFQAIDTEKRLVAGPLLIPNKKIIRMDEQMGMYNVFFKPETIETIARKFMKNKYNGEVTVEHDKKVNGVYLTESWIIEQSSKDKSNLFGYTLPKGTWFGIYKVDNDKVWEEVKAGKYRGFSIEGIFEHKASTMKSSQLFSKDIDELNENEADVILSMIKNLVKKDLRYKKKERILMESFSDYPDDVKNNAKNVLEFVDRNGWGSCGTPVGKQRANQLSKGEPISLDTIKRMYSYLSRHEIDLENSKTYSDGCGKLMYDAWGGKSGLSWSRNKLRELGELGDE